MLTSRPAPLTASRPLHARTPGKALQKNRGILQENALHAPRTAKTLRVELQTPLKGKYSAEYHLPFDLELVFQRRFAKESA